ncbi:MAG: pyridoxal-phosphate dependent enzyme [Ferroplasma sp.]
MEIESEDKPPGSPLLREYDIGNFLKESLWFIKYEGSNPTGTQKDRISRLHVENAISKGYNEISVATCGNYGASIAYYAQKYGIKAIVGIPSQYSNSRRSEIEKYGATVIEEPLAYEDMVEHMRDMSMKNRWYDASPGSSNSAIDIEGYSDIGIEICNQLGFAPEFVSVPVGNGTTLYGIYRGFYKLFKKKKIGRMPHFIATSTEFGNPIIYSFIHGFRNIVELNKTDIIETEINEPLISYRSYDGQHALNVLHRTEGKAIYVSDGEMKNISEQFMRDDGLSVLPASASAVAGALKFAKGHSCAIIITGSDK